MTEKGKRDTYIFGHAAEIFAAAVLMLKGYRVLARRYKTPVGEIDIVAQKNDMLAFVEVKARARIGDALEAVTPRMRGRIGRAGLHFLARHPDKAAMQIRCDLFAVAPPCFWRHLDNAWEIST